MEIAKIITDGNTGMLVLPDNILPGCEAVEIHRNDAGIILVPKNSAEKYEVLPGEEILKISARIIDRHLEAYKELAK